MTTREVEYFVAVFNDDGSLFCNRAGKKFFAQLCIDRFGIDHVKLKPLHGDDEDYYHPSVFGFKQSRIKKNRAVSEARLRNRQPHLGSNLPG